MKLKATVLAAGFLLGLIPALACAQDFSANVVYAATKSDVPSATNESASSKLYVSKDKIRLETHGFSDTVLLVNSADHSAFILFPARKKYQEIEPSSARYFRVEDGENACPDWQKATSEKVVCEKLGNETVDGRQTVKYRNTAASASSVTTVWIDPALKFVIKWEDATTSAELRNIKQEPQAAGLFSVPSAYEPLSPQKSSAKGFHQRSK